MKGKLNFQWSNCQPLCHLKYNVVADVQNIFYFIFALQESYYLQIRHYIWNWTTLAIIAINQMLWKCNVVSPFGFADHIINTFILILWSLYIIFQTDNKKLVIYIYTVIQVLKSISLERKWHWNSNITRMYFCLPPSIKNWSIIPSWRKLLL